MKDTNACLMQDFIGRNLSVFGLYGSNNHNKNDIVVAYDKSHAKTIESLFGESGFLYGFDDNIFGDRRSAECKFWTEYKFNESCFGDFECESTRVVENIFKKYNTIYLNAYGGYSTAIFLKLAKNIGRPVDVVAIRFLEDSKSPESLSDIRNTFEFCVSIDEFREFAVQYCKELACTDAWIALDVFAAHKSPGAYIFDSWDIRLENSSFDEKMNCSVGPPIWSLIDNEKYTSIPRWMAMNKKQGVPSWMRSSASIAACYLVAGSIQQEALLHKTGDIKGRYNYRGRLAIAHSLNCEAPIRLGLKSAYRYSAVSSVIEDISREMRKMFSSFSTVHRTPVSRLLNGANPGLTSSFGFGAKLFGTVEP